MEETYQSTTVSSTHWKTLPLGPLWGSQLPSINFKERKHNIAIFLEGIMETRELEDDNVTSIHRDFL